MGRSNRRVVVAVVTSLAAVAGAPWLATAASGTPGAPPPTVPLPPLPGADPGDPTPTMPAPTAPTAPIPTPTAPTSTAPTATALEPATPGAFVPITDDTGLLNVEVPVTWTDIDTRPISGDDGSVRLSITAAPNWDDFVSRFDAPGLIYSAYPFSTDPEPIFSRFAFDGFCRDGGRQSYSDGAFVGQEQLWAACDGTVAELRVVVANPPDNSFTALIVVQIPTPADLPAYQHVLDTFNADPSVGMPTATVPSVTIGSSTVPPPPVPSSTVPVVTVPPKTAATPAMTVPPTTAATAPPMTGSLAVTVPPTTMPPAKAVTSPEPGFQTVTDASGRLSVQVPLTWSDVNGSPGTDADGTSVVALSAAPDLGVFSDTYDGPGLLFREVPYTRDPSVFLQNFTFTECTDGGLSASPRAGYVGVVQTWTDCGGTAAEIHVVAANPLDGRQVTALLVIQTVTPADAAALPVALTTFEIR
ncbi:hypothetical protein BH24ACT5_BH24ACT5_08410 [soil metagenome]